MKIAMLLAGSLLSSIASAQSAKPPVKSPPQEGRPPLKTRPSGDQAIIHTVADAMGFVRGYGQAETTNTLNRLQWFGKGSMFADGHTYQVVKYSYAMSLHLIGAREDIQRKTAGGKNERIVHAFLGTGAWNETTPGVGMTPAPGEDEARRAQFFCTPFGFTSALLKAAPSTVKVSDPGPGHAVTISMAIEGAPYMAVLDRDYRPASIGTTLNGQKIEMLYADYRDLANYGVMFSTHTIEKSGGRTTLDLTIDDGRVASYLILQPPAKGEN